MQQCAWVIVSIYKNLTCAVLPILLLGINYAAVVKMHVVINQWPLCFQGAVHCHG